VYGRSKLAGDQAIDAVDGAHLIFRTSWVYGTRGKNFYLTMCRLAEEGRTIRVVGDQVGCPTWSRTIAEISSGVVLHAMGNRARSAYERIYEQRGIYNLVSRAHTSWCGFAQAILDGRAIVQPITSDEFPSKARRPAYSVLSTRKLEETFGFRPPLWTEALEEVKLEHAARNEHLIR
jgi:dTDP-4-dehydrorhamnose reductase